MHIIGRIFLIVVVAIIAIITKIYIDISQPIPPPEIDVDSYWGVGDKVTYVEDPKLVLSKIHYDDKIIDDLKQKLTDYKEFTEPLENSGFQYGFNHKELKKIVKYWNNTYLKSWDKHEQDLNQFPHYFTEIQGLKIHYIHVKPKLVAGITVYPIILLHGWPGSIREFYEIIPKLINNEDNKNFTFEVIIPSLPGHGWSQAPSKRGLGLPEIAVIMRNLMLKLGHKHFFIQGGNWGSAIGSYIASMFPENILGYHSNLCTSMSPMANIKRMMASLYPALFVDEKYIDWFFPLSKKFKFGISESGYYFIQATKPDTIGAALQNNPVGLAAYILEKFSTWTNPNNVNLEDGGLTSNFKLDALLDNVMIYYLTNSITTSMRLYPEVFGARIISEMDRIPIKVPTACAIFKYELFNQIDWVLSEKYLNLIQRNYHDNGGHFAALQVPNVLYKDLIEFINKVF